MSPTIYLEENPDVSLKHEAQSNPLYFARSALVVWSWEPFGSGTATIINITIKGH
jgi:hypothetical protein